MRRGSGIMAGKQRLTCKQRVWFYCKGAIYFKLLMLAIKIIVIGLIFYIGAPDEMTKVELRLTENTDATRTPLEICPYVHAFDKRELGLAMRILVNVRWVITLPIVIAQTALGTCNTSKDADAVTVYDCSLSPWRPERVFQTWTLQKEVYLGKKSQHRLNPNEGQTGSDHFTVFQPKMSLAELTVMYDLVGVFAREASSRHLTFFLYGESLLDAFHHHGMAPWNDVINLAVPFTNRTRLKEFLNTNKKYAFVMNTAGTEAAFFSTTLSKPIKGSEYRWPYIKVSFYGEDFRQIWDRNPKFAFSRRYERRSVFPLQSRPFWNLWLPVPRETENLLSKSADVTLCRSPTHNHRTGRWIPQRAVVSIPCSFLYKRIPLVFRQEVKEGTAETLRKDTDTLQTILLVHEHKHGVL